MMGTLPAQFAALRSQQVRGEFDKPASVQYICGSQADKEAN
jgi:hypothetical protein